MNYSKIVLQATFIACLSFSSFHPGINFLEGSSSKLFLQHPIKEIKYAVEHNRKAVQTDLELRLKKAYVAPWVQRTAVSAGVGAFIYQMTNKPLLSLLGSTVTEICNDVFVEHRWGKRTLEEKKEFLQKKRDVIKSEPLYKILKSHGGLLKRYSDALTKSYEMNKALSSTEGCYPGTSIPSNSDDFNELKCFWEEMACEYPSFEKFYKALESWLHKVVLLEGIVTDYKTHFTEEDVELYGEIKDIEKTIKMVTGLVQYMQLLSDIAENEELFVAALQSGKSDKSS